MLPMIITALVFPFLFDRLTVPGMPVQVHSKDQKSVASAEGVAAEIEPPLWRSNHWFLVLWVGKFDWNEGKASPSIKIHYPWTLKSIRDHIYTRKETSNAEKAPICILWLWWYGGFLKWGYPQMDGLQGKIPSRGTPMTQKTPICISMNCGCRNPKWLRDTPLEPACWTPQIPAMMAASSQFSLFVWNFKQNSGKPLKFEDTWSVIPWYSRFSDTPKQLRIYCEDKLEAGNSLRFSTTCMWTAGGFSRRHSQAPKRMVQNDSPVELDGATNNSLTFWGSLVPMSSLRWRFHYAEALHFLHEGPVLLHIWRWVHPLPSLHLWWSEKTTKSHLVRPLVFVSLNRQTRLFLQTKVVCCRGHFGTSEGHTVRLDSMKVASWEARETRPWCTEEKRKINRMLPRQQEESPTHTTSVGSFQ